jgi:hypothetical protein
MRLLALIVLITAACASDGASATEDSNIFVINGIYNYIDGDRITWKCSRRQCTDVVIRDRRLAQSAVKLLNKRVTLRVKRVAACGAESTQVVCLRSRSGTALLIVEWL